MDYANSQAWIWILRQIVNPICKMILLCILQDFLECAW